MKRLHSFILKSFLGPLAFTFFISMFVLLMQFLWRYIDEFVGKGLEWTVIAEFLFYVSATLVPMALPLAILLASIMTFGNMGENYELTAMKAAGISLQRIMKPLTIFIIMLSIGAFYFSNIIMPIASLKTSSLLYDIKRQNPELILKEGIFTNDLPKFSVKVGKIDKQSGMMYDLLIYDHRKNQGNTDVTVADSGTMVTSSDKLTMILTLYSGNKYSDIKPKGRKKKKDHPSQRIKFAEYKSLISLPGNDLKRGDESRFANSYRMLNLGQLVNQQDTLQKKLSTDKVNLAKTLRARNYFQKEPKRFYDDTVKSPLILAKVLNSDSLFTNLNSTKKLTTISYALDKSRKTRESISRKEREFTSQQKWMRKFQNEWHRKFTLPFACFIFFFIGAPLGAIIRKGGLGMPVIISVLFFIIYYIISMIAERSSKELVLTPFWGMWLSSIIILPLGIILTYKATTDSSIFNIENYIDFFKKIKPKKL